MKILLINPFGSNWVEGMEDHTEIAIRMAPIGILSVAAYLLKQEGYSVSDNVDVSGIDLFGIFCDSREHGIQDIVNIKPT